MGAWGRRNFENDSAMDFVGEFLESPSEVAISASLGFVIDARADEEYIEVDEASAALAAAEIVAAIIGRAASDLPEELSAAIEKMGFEANQKIIQQARKAVSVIIRESELQELWAEGGEPNDWQQVQHELLTRLG
ncbi:DUF4259 domain-containing protein [Hymenobacter sp. UYCo722]|uniref:DUF4259 domain-containing protein n=1 Tax=Hymenobacter sp. UYCo722 TaxID=3156335 RepID=UPI003391C8F8